MPRPASSSARSCSARASAARPRFSTAATSAAILKAYTAAFDPTFLALYGSPERLADTAKSFGVIYRKVPTGSSYSIDHTASSYIFDPHGKLRLRLSHGLGAHEYAADIRTLLKAG